MAYRLSPSPLASQTSLPLRSSPHSRTPSFDYQPVPRHTSGAQQHSPLSPVSPLPPQTLDRDDQALLSSPPGPHVRKQEHAFLVSGFSLLHWVCYVLHWLLVIMHAVLLGMLLTGVDHRVTISPTKANFYSVLLTVVQQTFFTIYQGALVVITQQLALRSNLLRRQTLTALHDKSSAWGGLGASILSLWRQGSMPTAVYGTLCVVLYLVSISVLHVSSSSLVDIETYNNNVPSLVKTNLGVPNMTAVMEAFDDQSWDNVAVVASAIGQLPETFNYGVAGNTVYDTLTDTSGVGNVTVNATTFTVKCYSANTAQIPFDSSSVNIVWGDFTTFFTIFPLYEGALWFVDGQLEGPVKGRLLSFLSFPPIYDSNGSNGTMFPVIGTVYPAIHNITTIDGVNVTQGPWNYTIASDLQATTCSLSYTTQTAVVDSQTNALLSVAPSADQAPSAWTQNTNLNSTGYDPMIDWFWTAFESSSATTLLVSPSILCSNAYYACQLSLLNSRLLSMLGLEINPMTYVVDGQNANITTPAKSNATLSQLEEMLGMLAAEMIWTVGHINSTASSLIQLTGEVEVSKTVLSSRLNFNIVPVCVGLCVSIFLLLLAHILTRTAAQAEDNHTPGNAGILQLLWLFSRQPGIRESLYDVDEPSEEQLRKAGLVNVQAVDSHELMDFGKR
ncbi:hypothetical protein HYDPIDRAFT_31555 [Hydnomerulius pinastri MD-312]|uniref:Transmembrane protein n=1 Tax=Hydnomerulius pinastri MD-312 TaxID=994086 RepID=A0A0C9WBZ7_9AGAM|nr:hypothetical protein HYDPIDRAFT_31555 [Hydnomerulius pinastri MD-312]